MSMKCVSCGMENRDGACYCRFCGAEIAKTLLQPLPETEHPVSIADSVPVKKETVNEETVKKETASDGFSGLESIRADLEKFERQRIIQREREKNGFPPSLQNTVLVFQGATGTGKSTVAAWFADKLKTDGVINGRTGRFTAKALWNQYKDEFEIKKFMQENKYSLIIIDEVQTDTAYIHEILSGIASGQSACICIIIGLKNKFDDFFKDKPEDVQWVSSFYDFPNEDDNLLAEILFKKLTLDTMKFTEKVKKLLFQCVVEKHHQKDCHYENGWIVEKDIIPSVLRNQSERLTQMEKCSKDDYMTILEEDVPVTCHIQTPEEILADLNKMIGLKAAKEAVTELLNTVSVQKEREAKGLKDQIPAIHIVFTGNPGTGKTTVARMLGKLFQSIGLLPSDKVVETDRSGIVAQYVGQTAPKMNEWCDKAMGGILFIDEAYTLCGIEGSSDSFGQEAIDALLKRMEDDRGKFVVIAAGYKKEMEKFINSNPGLKSRFTHFINLDDYTPEELEAIYEFDAARGGYLLTPAAKKVVTDCIRELYDERGKDFANGRTVRNLFDATIRKMGTRISRLPPEQRTKEMLSLITESDIPFEKKKTKTAEEIMADLNQMIGLTEAKQAVKQLMETINLQKERAEKGLKDQNPAIHIVFTGNPGTGKTTVARMLGQLFEAIGLLPTDKLIETEKSGLCGQYVGETPKKTNELCDKAMGGILFIDEAYTLCGSDGTKDPYGQEAIDTLLKRMEDDRGKFVVIVAGYKDRMETFIESNPGLKSRFTHFIHLQDYKPDELAAIYRLDVNKGGYILSSDAEPGLRDCIQKIYNERGKDFANGRTIRNLYDETIRRMGTRLAEMPPDKRTAEALSTILAEDIPFEKTVKKSAEELLSELDQMIGLADVKKEVRRLIETISMQQKRAESGIKTETPAVHIVFMGNPGTGKTTVARMLGKLFQSIGLLPSDKVVETDRSGLVGQYIGSTAPLVNAMCDKAMGGILFIDEAYTLAKGGGNDFGQEAIDTILKRMEDDRGKFIVIAAGYENDMNRFLESNPGLKSRFTDFFHLADYTPDELYAIFKLDVKRGDYILTEEAETAVRILIAEVYEARGKDFANGRTVRNIFEATIRNMGGRIARITDEQLKVNPELLKTITKDDIPQNGGEQ